MITENVIILILLWKQWPGLRTVVRNGSLSPEYFQELLAGKECSFGNFVEDPELDKAKDQ